MGFWASVVPGTLAKIELAEADASDGIGDGGHGRVRGADPPRSRGGGGTAAVTAAVTTTVSAAVSAVAAAVVATAVATTVCARPIIVAVRAIVRA